MNAAARRVGGRSAKSGSVTTARARDCSTSAASSPGPGSGGRKTTRQPMRCTASCTSTESTRLARNSPTPSPGSSPCRRSACPRPNSRCRASLLVSRCSPWTSASALSSVCQCSRMRSTYVRDSVVCCALTIMDICKHATRGPGRRRGRVRPETGGVLCPALGILAVLLRATRTVRDGPQGRERCPSGPCPEGHPGRVRARSATPCPCMGHGSGGSCRGHLAPLASSGAHVVR